MVQLRLNRIEDSVIRTLARGNDTLMDVVNEFGRLCRTNGPAQHMILPCFYERRQTRVGRIIDIQLPEVAKPRYGFALDVWSNLQ